MFNITWTLIIIIQPLEKLRLDSISQMFTDNHILEFNVRLEGLHGPPAIVHYSWCLFDKSALSD